MMDFKIETTLDNSGYKYLLKQLEILEKHSVDVGVFEDASVHPTGLPVATVAYLQHVERWANGNYVPARPFIPQAMYRVINTKEFAGLYKKLFRKNANVKSRLNAIAQALEDTVKQEIREFKDPPNTPATIARKGGRNTPLRDTDTMLDSIKAKVRLAGEGNADTTV